MIDPNREDLIRLKLQKLEILEKQKRLQHCLPHIYAHNGKTYTWTDEFWECTKRRQVLVAANQISKSSSHYRKAIRVATDPSCWKKYWPNLDGQWTVNSNVHTQQQLAGTWEGERPSLWWLFGPDRTSMTTEFHEKWKLYLPKDEFKGHPLFGWDHTVAHKEVDSIVFNTGITLQFKSYGIREENLQSSTVYWLLVDEEMPVHLLPELLMRIDAKDGMFSAAFTATQGQKFWKDVVENRTEWDDEQTRVWSVSMYDCIEYSDGSQSPWTVERIKNRERTLGNKNEIAKRVLGRFVVDTGRVYQGFDDDVNVKPHHPIKSSDWFYYAGVDYGSGGSSGNPSSIVVVAMDSSSTRLRVVRAWRGDRVQTTADDVVTKYESIVKTIGYPVVSAYYDWSCPDLGMIANSRGLPFVKADKSRTTGIAALDSLFRTKAMVLYVPPKPPKALPFPSDHLETQKLVDELNTMTVDSPKPRPGEHHWDLCDSLRYAISKLPLDWAKITELSEVKEDDYRAPVAKTPDEEADEERKRTMNIRSSSLEQESNEASIEQEMSDFNNSAGYDFEEYYGDNL